MCNCNDGLAQIHICNVIVIITEHILAVIIITFKYFLNTFGYLLKKICSPLETNWLVMSCGIILSRMIEKTYTLDILIHKKYCLLWTID